MDARRGWYAAGLVVVAVGLLAVGVGPSTVLFGAFVLACPLMMLLMHRGHGARDDQDRWSQGHEPDHAAASGSDRSSIGSKR
jgi:hypothetical protein